MAQKILRLPEVIKRTGKSRTRIYAAIAAGDFPQRIELGVRAVGWKESDIDEWIESRPMKNKAPAPIGAGHIAGAGA